MERRLRREEDSLRLNRLRAAVRLDFTRSAMIYASSDLATWLERSMAKRGRHLEVTADDAGDLVFADPDPGAWAIIARGAETGSFD